MTDDEWLSVVEAFVERRIDENEFHDRFFTIWNWHSNRSFPDPIPKAIEQLFFTVEAYCPDPTLRDPTSPYEADEAELRRDAEIALQKLKSTPPQRNLT